MAPMAADVEQNTEDMPSGGMQQAGAMRLEELPCHIARRYWLRSRAERRAESEQDLPAAAAHCVVFPPCCGMRCSDPRARLHERTRQLARTADARTRARRTHAHEVSTKYEYPTMPLARLTHRQFGCTAGSLLKEEVLCAAGSAAAALSGRAAASPVTGDLRASARAPTWFGRFGPHQLGLTRQNRVPPACSCVAVTP
eukprot:COSAG03_NODE_2898_length_2367_cov_8.913580_2_plen_198_part_00